VEFTVQGLLLFVLVLVPGAHARLASARSTPVPWEQSFRSPLQELIEILLYSIVNVVVVMLALAAVGVGFFGEEQNLRTLINGGIDAFPVEERIHGFVWILVYIFVALLFAEISGSTQLLLRVRVFVATLFFYGDDWTHSTIWYWAIDKETRSAHPDRAVGARVVVKDGSLYTGVIANYPVLGDNVEKDFVLQHVHRYNAETRKFEAFGPRMSLLLNSRDCWSVQVGPGPEQEVPARSRWEQGTQVFLWILLLIVSSLTLAALIARPAADLLSNVLAFFSATVTTWSFLALVRYLLRVQSPSRWDEVSVQRLWLFAGAISMLDVLLWLAGANTLVASIGFAVAGGFVAASLIMPISRGGASAG
jgi:hypothetical protein